MGCTDAGYRFSTSLLAWLTALDETGRGSAYLFTHPEVNGFMNGLKGQPRDDIRAQVLSA